MTADDDTLLQIVPSVIIVPLLIKVLNYHVA